MASKNQVAPELQLDDTLVPHPNQKRCSTAEKKGFDDIVKAAINKNDNQGDYIKEVTGYNKLNPPPKVSVDSNLRNAKRKLRANDTLAAILAIAGILLAYYENEDFYKTESNGESKERNESTDFGNAMRALNMLITIILCVCIVLHYKLKLSLMKLKKLRPPNDSIRSAGMTTPLFLELFVCAICCPPYLDSTFSGRMLGGTYVYSYNAIIFVIMLLRGYLVLRLFGQYSRWTNDKAEKICRKYKTEATVMFAIKSELKQRPYLMIGIGLFLSILFLGAAIRTFEQPYVGEQVSSLDFQYMTNAMWLVIITMTTVGYGDGYPSTHCGRIIATIACIIGMLLISLMVVSLTVSSEFSKEEAKAYYILKRLYAHDAVKEKASDVIKAAFRLTNVKGFQTAKTSSNTVMLRFIWFTKMKKSITIFKNDNKVANNYEQPTDEMLHQLQEKLEGDIEEIKEEVSGIPELQMRCLRLKEKQSAISKKFDDILKLQHGIGDMLVNMHNSMSTK